MHFRSGPCWPHSLRCVYLSGFDAPSVPDPIFTDSIDIHRRVIRKRRTFFPLFLIASVQAVRSLAYNFGRTQRASFACAASKGACSCSIFWALVSRESRLRPPFFWGSALPSLPALRLRRHSLRTPGAGGVQHVRFFLFHRRRTWFDVSEFSASFPPFSRFADCWCDPKTRLHRGADVPLDGGFVAVYLVLFCPPPSPRPSGIFFSSPDPDASCPLACSCTDVSNPVLSVYNKIVPVCVRSFRFLLPRCGTPGRPTFFLSGRLQ